MDWRIEPSKVVGMKSLYALAAAVVFLVGCGGNQENTSTQGGTNFTSRPSDRPLNGAREFLTKGSGAKAIEAGNALGFNLLAASYKDGNVALSPFALASGLGLILNGTGGETREALVKALKLGKLGAQDLNAASKAIREELAGRDEKVELKIANSYWLNDGAEFKADFMKANRSSYGGHLAVAKLADKDGVAAINKWVSESTSGLLKSALTEGLDGSALALNGAAFRGAWKTGFDPAATRGEKFTPTKGEPTSTAMMSRAGMFWRASTEALEAVRLPYADGKTSMVLLLPKGDLVEALKGLDSAKWTALLEAFKEETGLVVLPKFKLSYENELSEELAGVGFQALLASGADLSGMASGKPTLSRILHKASLEVSEEGVEQAADPGESLQGFSFRADRPFVFVVVDDATRAILLLGVYGKPD